MKTLRLTDRWLFQPVSPLHQETEARPLWFWLCHSCVTLSKSLCLSGLQFSIYNVVGVGMLSEMVSAILSYSML